jgi:hypothetical protein
MMKARPFFLRLFGIAQRRNEIATEVKQEMEGKPNFYTFQEAAELLSLPAEEISRLANEGELTSRRLITAQSVLHFAAISGIKLPQGKSVR